MKHLHDLPAWSKLWIHFDETKEQHMREMFDQDPERAERYWLQVGGLTLDYSKNRINDETMALLFELAREAACAPADRAVLVDFLGVALNIGGLDAVAAA